MIDKFEADVTAALQLSPEDRRRHLAQASKTPRKILVTIEQYDRNQFVAAEVLTRANGICKECERPAPFLKSKDGMPYLEVHHREFLAKGGEDTVENAVALCPNCHRKAHFGQQ